MTMPQVGLGDAASERFFWAFTFKNRRVLLPILIILIFIAVVVVFRHFLYLDAQLTKLSRYEPIRVLVFARDLNIGESISAADLKTIIFYKDEFAKMIYSDPVSKTDMKLLIRCHDVAQHQGALCEEDIVGRVVNLPVTKDTLVYRNFLAAPGTSPGLLHLIEKGHTLFDIEVDQVGYNVYIKPDDTLDLYEYGDHGTRLLANKVKVILVDSLALGQAPLQVENDSRRKRRVTLALPSTKLGEAARAQRNKVLVATYHNGSEPMHFVASNRKLQQSDFKSLIMIQGDHKELVTR